PREQRADEDDDHDPDLPGYADGGVAHIAHVAADHDVVDQPLEAADDVLQHRGPGQLPDGAPDRSLDDRSVESPARAWDLHRIPPRRAGRLQIQSRSGLSVTYRSLTRTRLHALRARPARKTCKLIDAR